MLSAVCCDLYFSSLRTEGVYFAPAATPKESVFLLREPVKTLSMLNPDGFPRSPLISLCLATQREYFLYLRRDLLQDLLLIIFNQLKNKNNKNRPGLAGGSMQSFLRVTDQLIWCNKRVNEDNKSLTPKGKAFLLLLINGTLPGLGWNVSILQGWTPPTRNPSRLQSSCELFQ